MRTPSCGRKALPDPTLSASPALCWAAPLASATWTCFLWLEYLVFSASGPLHLQVFLAEGSCRNSVCLAFSSLGSQPKCHCFRKDSLALLPFLWLTLYHTTLSSLPTCFLLSASFSSLYVTQIVLPSCLCIVLTVSFPKMHVPQSWGLVCLLFAFSSVPTILDP